MVYMYHSFLVHSSADGLAMIKPLHFLISLSQISCVSVSSSQRTQNNTETEIEIEQEREVRF